MNGMSTIELGIFARTFTRKTLEENLDAVTRHGLSVVQYNMACAGLPSLPEHQTSSTTGRPSRYLGLGGRDPRDYPDHPRHT